MFLPLILAYATTFDWMYQSWGFREAYYAHGSLVVVFAAVMVFRWRKLWRECPADWDARGWYLLGPGLLLHLCGAALMVDSLSGASLMLSVPGAVWLALGVGRLRVLAPILGLLPFVIPLPGPIQGQVAFRLKEIAIRIGLDLANQFGAGAAREGVVIRFDGLEGTLFVADPCSGLRSLVALTTLGYCVAFFMGSRRGWRPWLLLLAAGPIAVLTNVLRIAAVCWTARGYGIEYASGAGHDLIGYGVWIVDLGLLLAVDSVLSRRRRRAS